MHTFVYRHNFVVDILVDVYKQHLVLRKIKYCNHYGQKRSPQRSKFYQNYCLSPLPKNQLDQYNLPLPHRENWYKFGGKVYKLHSQHIHLSRKSYVFFALRLRVVHFLIHPSTPNHIHCTVYLLIF